MTKEGGNAMKKKVQDLIMNDRISDAIALARRTKITTLDVSFIKDVLYSPKTKLDCWDLSFNAKMRLAEIFKFDIPDDILQMEYAKLLDAPNRSWSGCIPATLDLIKKTEILPSKKLVETRYEQEMLHTPEVEYILKLCEVTRVPIKINPSILQKAFKLAIEYGEIERLEKIEKLLGQKWNPDKSDWDVDTIIQEGYINIRKMGHYDIRKFKKFEKRVRIKPTEKTLLEVYTSVIRDSLKHTKCCGDLLGAETVIRFAEHYHPKQFSADVLRIVEDIFLNYRPPELFFDYLTFQRCFPNFKLAKDSELRQKIEEQCEETAKKANYFDDIINYLRTVKKCLGFTPLISAESLSSMRKSLEENDKYQLLEEIDAIFQK